MRLLFIAVFISLSFNESFSQNFDIDLLRKCHSNEPLPADGFFLGVSNTTKAVSIGVPVALGVTGLLKKDDAMTRHAVFMAAGSGLNYVLTYSVKNIVDRPRPYITYPDIIPKSTEGSASFPSGHTSGAFTTATYLSLAYPKWYVIAPSYAWAASVGYSRLYLGVHYPSDVFAGALLGAGSAYLSFKANQWIQKRYEKRQLPK
jgi:membrane-associated phospholipid phosphatase